jgi:hypothetical protein
MALEAATSPRIMRDKHTSRKGRVFPAEENAPDFYPSAGSKRSGQSMIETSLAMFIICLMFFGLFQISQLAAAREILYHAAARGARAKTVGFNQFMVSKAIRVASIPNAGRMTEPEFENVDPALRGLIANHPPGEVWDNVLQHVTPSSIQQDIERARIPEYMASRNHPRSEYILDYEDWDTISWSVPHNAFGDIIEVSVSQQFPLKLPFHRAFYARDHVDLTGVSTLENHYPLYLEDRNW